MAGDDRGSPAMMPVPTTTTMDTLRYPLANFQLTPRQEAQQEYLNQRLERDCMRRFGFDFLPGLRDQTDQAVAISAEFASRRYGITDPALAARFGYRLSTATGGPGAPQSVNDLPRPALAALTGRAGAPADTPVGGCAGAAARALGISDRSSTGAQTVTGIGRTAFTSAQADPKVRAAFTAWARCMADQDHPYTDPYQAAADPRWQDGAAPSDLQLAVARVDLDCKAATNLVGIAFAVEAGYQVTGISHNARALERVRADLATQVQRLTTLLREHPPER